MALTKGLHSVQLVLIICLCLCGICDSQSNNPRRRQRNRNSQRQNQAELPTGLSAAYYNALDNQESTATPPMRPPGSPFEGPQAIASRTIWNNDWNRYTPSTPASNNIDCYVEVVSVQHLGGRCTQLGGTIQPYICQSGQHFEFKPECRQILNARQRSGS